MKCKLLIIFFNHGFIARLRVQKKTLNLKILKVLK